MDGSLLLETRKRQWFDSLWHFPIQREGSDVDCRFPQYASLKVAEQFRVLDALAPGRIDLGVGRAPGSDQLTARLLNPNLYASDEFPQ